jgi:ubiquitin carboxyl-terminal hydrolase 7
MFLNQAAEKGVIFTEFPPVLHLQLKRFEYDMERDAMVKVSDVILSL